MKELMLETDKKVESNEKKVSYPRKISRIVYVRRKKLSGAVPGDDPEEHILKIGSSFSGSAVLSGLTKDEEKRFLSTILSIEATSVNFEAAVNNYWRNISKEVPSGDGLKLETGLIYNSEEDYKADLESKNLTTFGKALINPKGTPINLPDYVLWRYCLEYNIVANVPEDVNNSPRILFYLYSKDKEVLTMKAKLEDKKEAMILAFKIMKDKEHVEHVLRVLIAGDKNPAKKYNLHELENMEDDEKELALDYYASEYPSRFVETANDNTLKMRSFIEECIAARHLTRVPNTDTIMMDSLTIGNSMTEAVGFLSNSKNSKTYEVLKAQLKQLP